MDEMTGSGQEVPQVRDDVMEQPAAMVTQGLQAVAPMQVDAQVALEQVALQVISDTVERHGEQVAAVPVAQGVQTVAPEQVALWQVTSILQVKSVQVAPEQVASVQVAPAQVARQVAAPTQVAMPTQVEQVIPSAQLVPQVGMLPAQVTLDPQVAAQVKSQVDVLVKLQIADVVGDNCFPATLKLIRLQLPFSTRITSPGDSWMREVSCCLRMA